MWKWKWKWNFGGRRKPSRKLNYSKSYYSKSKRDRQLLSRWWWLKTLGVILGAIVLLELSARVFVGLTGAHGDLTGETPLMRAYRLKFLTETQQPVEGLANPGSLVVKRSLPVGYQLVGKQQNQFLQINEQGFRDRDAISRVKPKGEIRIFILGGSTAFGQWNQNNEGTIATQLETRFQQRVAQQKRFPGKYRPDVFPFFKPDRLKAFALPSKIREGQYRVLNAAVPGYVSGNVLAQAALQILPYQPDLIVVLDGYTDLMLPSGENQTDIPQIDNFLQNAPGHYQTYINQSFHQWLNGTYLVKALKYLIFKPQPSLAEKSLVVNNSSAKSLGRSLPADDAELARRVQRYQENYQQMIRIYATAGIPVVVAVQPEITGRSPNQLSQAEKRIHEQLGKDYTQRMPKAYRRLITATGQLEKTFPNKVKVLSFYPLAPYFPAATFSDAIHLTEPANAVIAEQLYQTLATWQKIQIVPENLDFQPNQSS